MSYMSRVFDPKRHEKYKPKNPDKYIGKDYPIVRSGLEKAFCEMVDNNKNIIEWSSEPLYIPYMLQNKKKRYFPDFWLKVRTAMGECIWLVEIKHSNECHPPKKGKNKARKTLLNEKYTWEKNLAKWKAAKRYCNKMRWEFKIITEKELFK